MGRKFLFVICFFVAIASDAKITLVYKGPGSCEASKVTSGCSELSADIAKKMGYDVYFIGPDGALEDSVWDKASLWIQPGGLVRNQVLAMKPALLKRIREKVDAGMAYVGFCAGAFLAADRFGWPMDEKGNWYESKGLGLIPVYGHYYSDYDEDLDENNLAKILDVTWAGEKRFVYWELGPYFEGAEIKKRSQIETIAYYPKNKVADKGKVMTIRTTYGAGRVFVTAVHPEASQDWRSYYKINDPDGVDTDLAAEMIRWTATK